MSKLNDLDCELDVRTGTELFLVYKTLRRHLTQVGEIPRRDLVFLVHLALKHEEITQLRAAELLGYSLEDIYNTD